MIELTRKIVRKINKDKIIFKEPKILLPPNKITSRLPGIDGSNKMSKSLNNCIYLSDNPKELWEKVKKMYTDPTHINIKDQGHIEGNMVFTYLDAIQGFTEFDFSKIFGPSKGIDSLYKLEEAYKKGGIGDMSCKALLFNSLNNFLLDIREKREKAVRDKQKIMDKILSDSREANKIVNNNILLLKDKLKIRYGE
jgi:tryptophanyl-tRNA synthetase